MLYFKNSCYVLLNEKGEIFKSKIFNNHIDAEGFIVENFSSWEEFEELDLTLAVISRNTVSNENVKSISLLDICDIFPCWVLQDELQHDYHFPMFSERKGV